MHNNKAFIYFICLVSAMGGLLFGYDWVVIGGAKPFYETYFGIGNSPMMQGLAISRMSSSSILTILYPVPYEHSYPSPTTNPYKR